MIVNSKLPLGKYSITWNKIEENAVISYMELLSTPLTVIDSPPSKLTVTIENI